MKHFIFVAITWAFASLGFAQTHVVKAIDDVVVKHPEYVINYKKSEVNDPGQSNLVKQINRVYILSLTDTSVIDSLLAAFETDKMDGYNYIRTSAAYNQAVQKQRRKTVTLQNGELLNSYSTEYSFVSLSVVDSKQSNYRTNYILKWSSLRDGKIDAQLYILYGVRPNNR